MPTILLIIFLIIFGIFIFSYNTLIRTKNIVKESFSSIQVQLKRRYDLIPNLIEAVKGYSNYEKDTLTKITEARTKAINASGFENKVKAENKITETLKSLFAVSENYPDLKANQNFLKLQDSLTEVEDQIQHSRRFYNATVRDLNTKIEMFPSNIIAGMFNFVKREYFEIENEVEKENIKVSFAKPEATETKSE